MNAYAYITPDQQVELYLLDSDNEATVAVAPLADIMEGVEVEVVTKLGGYHDSTDILDANDVPWQHLDRDDKMDAVEYEVKQWAEGLGYTVLSSDLSNLD